jgi:dipeptidyl-peptidase-3
MVELGLIEAEHFDDVVRAEYEGFTRTALVQLRRLREGDTIEEDHMRNRQAIVHWLMANTSAIERRSRDGKTYYVMVDPVAFREGVGRLTAEIQRIKSEGDYAAAGEFLEKYGIYFEPALRDEIVARTDALNLAAYTAFVQPRLDAVVDAAGEITDVRISYPRDLTRQMLDYSARNGYVPRPHAAAGC